MSNHTSDIAGATYEQALTRLIDIVYAEHLKNNRDMPLKFNRSRDNIATSNTNIRLSARIMGIVGDGDFYEDERVTYGTFSNCREYGMTVSIDEWTFGVTEGRSSDWIEIHGVKTADMKPFGPYAESGDELAAFGPSEDYEAGQALMAMMGRVVNRDGELFKGKATREALKAEGKKMGGRR